MRKPESMKTNSTIRANTLFKVILPLDKLRKIFENKLLSCAYNGDVAGVKDALENGIDINTKTQMSGEFNGYTALIYACRFGHTEVVQTLINYAKEKTLNLNMTHVARIGGGYQAIHWAVREGHKDCVKILLEYMPDLVNERETSRNRTSLHIAYEYGQHNMVEFLISRGADPNLEDKAHKKPIEYRKIQYISNPINFKKDGALSEDTQSRIASVSAYVEEIRKKKIKNLQESERVLKQEYKKIKRMSQEFTIDDLNYIDELYRRYVDIYQPLFGNHVDFDAIAHYPPVDYKKAPNDKKYAEEKIKKIYLVLSPAAQLNVNDQQSMTLRTLGGFYNEIFKMATDAENWEEKLVTRLWTQMNSKLTYSNRGVNALLATLIDFIEEKLLTHYPAEKIDVWSAAELEYVSRLRGYIMYCGEASSKKIAFQPDWRLLQERAMELVHLEKQQFSVDTSKKPSHSSNVENKYELATRLWTQINSIFNHSNREGSMKNLNESSSKLATLLNSIEKKLLMHYPAENFDTWSAEELEYATYLRGYIMYCREAGLKKEVFRPDWYLLQGLDDELTPPEKQKFTGNTSGETSYSSNEFQFDDYVIDRTGELELSIEFEEEAPNNAEVCFKQLVEYIRQKKLVFEFDGELRNKKLILKLKNAQETEILYNDLQRAGMKTRDSEEMKKMNSTI